MESTGSATTRHASREARKATGHAASTGRLKGVGVGRRTAADHIVEAEFVVGFALFGVGEELEGFGDFFEFLGGVGGFVFVGMPFEGCFAGWGSAWVCEMNGEG